MAGKLVRTIDLMQSADKDYSDGHDVSPAALGMVCGRWVLHEGSGAPGKAPTSTRWIDNDVWVTNATSLRCSALSYQVASDSAQPSRELGFLGRSHKFA
jgi:hypothetical protein